MKTSLAKKRRTATLSKCLLAVTFVSSFVCFASAIASASNNATNIFILAGFYVIILTVASFAYAANAADEYDRARRNILNN